MNFSITSIFFTLSVLVEVTSSVTAAPGTSIDIFKHPVTAQEDAMHPDLELAIVGGGEADVTDYPYYGKQTTLIFLDLSIKKTAFRQLTRR